jgi:peptide/nickel transport system substrate-binding protein
MRRPRRALPAVLVTVALASACGGGGGGGGTSGAAGGDAADDREAKAGGTLALALAEDPDALDPTLARTLVSREVFVSMCEKLYDVDENLELIPQLAAELPVASEDGMSVTIKLRDDVVFNDGTPFDAEAVKVTIERHLTLEGSARQADLAAVESVEVVDPTTVQLNLKAAFAPLTAQLADRAGMIMSPTQLKALGDQFATDPVCVGPFQFVSRTAGNEIVLKKAPDYYDADKVKLDGVTYRIITDGNVRQANVKSGDVQVAERLQPTDVATLENDPAVKLIAQESIGYQGISINVGNVAGAAAPPGEVDTALGGSPELREAFELSLDRDVINEVVFAGRYTTGCTPLPPASPYHDKSIECSTRDLDRARELIAESGASTPVPVTLTVGTSPENLRLGQVIQSQAKEAGFEVKVAPTEFTSALDASDAGDFDTFQVGWSGRVDPDGNTYNFWHTGSSLNRSGYSNPEVDALLDQARLTEDEAERKELYTQATEMVLEDRPLIYLYHPVNYLATAPDVVGVEYYADGLPRLKTAGLAQ